MAGSRTVTWRAVAATVALTAVLALAFALPIPPDAFMMGDGSSITNDRGNFNEVILNDDVLRFSAHLSYWLIGRFDAALGMTDKSPVQAYHLLSWLVGALSALSLWILAASERWSPRAVRYVALAIMAPATLMYFGYVEVGHLALSAAAFPFVARDLVKGGDLTWGLLVGAVLFGLGAAMHGIGYLGIAALCLAVLAADIPFTRRLVLAPALSAIAVGAALIWLWYYLAVLGLEITPGHATGGFIVRPLWESREAEGRILYPLLSAMTARDLFMSGLIAGLPLLLVVLFNRAQWLREARLALAFTVPCAIALVLFWPVQGVAIELDMIVAIFPAVFALLWVCSLSARASVASAGLLALGHAAFWWVVYDPRFINRMLR
jgi:hypothetical protein